MPTFYQFLDPETGQVLVPHTSLHSLPLDRYPEYPDRFTPWSDLTPEARRRYRGTVPIPPHMSPGSREISPLYAFDAPTVTGSHAFYQWVMHGVLPVVPTTRKQVLPFDYSGGSWDDALSEIVRGSHALKRVTGTVHGWYQIKQQPYPHLPPIPESCAAYGNVTLVFGTEFTGLVTTRSQADHLLLYKLLGPKHRFETVHPAAPQSAVKLLTPGEAATA